MPNVGKYDFRAKKKNNRIPFALSLNKAIVQRQIII